MTVRVRSAPSSSGDLHLGNVRTALFNFYFARHNGGTFVLRVEDTDPEKAKPELIGSIYEAMHWIGMDWDEGPDVGGPYGPYRQSERSYADATEHLERNGFVYRCYCTREEILARGTKTGYDRYCRKLSDAQRAAFEAEERPYAFRFVVPEGRDVHVPDLIRGDVITPFHEMQDFVVVRSDGSPTFPFANAIDDIAMRITHVIRGADLLNAAAANTLVFEAMGASPPVYAHVPLLLAPDRSRLGTRHGATGILEYRREGYLAEAMRNYLSLLGWSSESGDEFLTKERLIEEFTIDRVQSSPAVFDRTKLDWMNAEYLKQLDHDDLVHRVLELAPGTPEDTLRAAVDLELIQTRVTRLAQIPLEIRYLHERPEIDPKAAEKWLGTEEANAILEAVAEKLEGLEPWTPEAIRETVQATIETLGAHRRRGPKPIFVAISGSEVALPIFQSIWIIGRDEAVARLRDAIVDSTPTV